MNVIIVTMDIEALSRDAHENGADLERIPDVGAVQRVPGEALDRADDEKLRTSPPNHDVPVPDDGVSVELVRNSGCCGC